MNSNQILNVSYILGDHLDYLYNRSYILIKNLEEDIGYSIEDGEKLCDDLYNYAHNNLQISDYKMLGIVEYLLKNAIISNPEEEKLLEETYLELWEKL